VAYEQADDLALGRLDLLADDDPYRQLLVGQFERALDAVVVGHGQRVDTAPLASPDQRPVRRLAVGRPVGVAVQIDPDLRPVHPVSGSPSPAVTRAATGPAPARSAPAGAGPHASARATVSGAPRMRPSRHPGTCRARLV